MSKRKLVLPFEDNPYFRMFQATAFNMGIIQANATADITPWACGHHVNCSLSYGSNRIFSISVTPDWSESDNILWQQRINLRHDMVKEIYGCDEIELMKKMLRRGFYPSGRYNEEVIPEKLNYQRRYYPHGFLLIGYDDIEGGFISIGYLNDRKFRRFLIPYDTMKLALSTMQDYAFGSNFWKYNPDAVFKLDLPKIVSELSDYISSTTTRKVYSKGKCWGMEAMRQLADTFLLSSETKKYIDDRYSRGFMEHKYFMKMRVDYLISEGYIKNADLADCADRAYKMSETAHLLALKHNVTGSYRIAEKMHGVMNEVLALEERYLPELLSELQTALGREEI